MTAKSHSVKTRRSGDDATLKNRGLSNILAFKLYHYRGKTQMIGCSNTYKSFLINWHL